LKSSNTLPQLVAAAPACPVVTAVTATAPSAVGSINAGGAGALRSALDRQTQASATLTQVDSMRESATGVSSDDEMISLMRYQRAYQASLRVIETADQMMQQLLSIGR
jgi:flagellar hook-associated protein 1 FlgK